ncbi:cation diffusion facilitator family transporter [Mucilaginibacter sp. SP1R1]|uniref:cation diffusion facilitator family transporter n=1 Tax=Mucilaginibacter sp. SP1R1 TaxID=2723091 RepID=UPI00161C07A6|nr:cation diffusion facilitator family transporter [Mucilaginibacter sp. SP1R1]MBB6149929.1 cation diffusion facilitator family transporter [Mucilaginibacter sp. SP1R1]
MAAIDVHPSVKAIRTTQIGIGISIVLVFLKAISGHLGHSYALIADATETGADIFSSSLLWIGLRIAMKPADSKHPYGHGKAEPIVSIVISFCLMAAAVWIGWHAIEFVRTPHDMPKRFTLYILLVVMIIKECMFRYVLKVGKQIDSNAVKADAYHHRSDAITSVAAFIGITIALIAGKGYEGADDWAALLASGLIFYNAIQLLRPGLAEIMDAAPSAEIVNQIRELAGQVDKVKLIEKCYVRKMGFDYFVDLHIQLDPEMTVAEGHRIAHIVKDKLLDADLSIKDVLIHIEPYGHE